MMRGDHPAENHVTAEEKDKSVESANGCVGVGRRNSLFLRTEQVIEEHLVYHICLVLYSMVVTQELVLGIAVGIAVSQKERCLPHC